MIYSDNIIEKNAIVLRNLNINTLNTASDTWSGALTGYGFYGIPYEKPLAIDHIYYSRATYKFTTTNQSPTWCTLYSQGGSVAGGGSINNPTANTEYTISGLWNPVLPYTLSSGTLYNGNYNAIAGVSSYVKNVLVYDVTDLYQVLLSNGVVTNDTTLKTWCDNNLIHKPCYVDYDVSSLLGTNSNKVAFKKDAIVANEFIECDGMQIYSINDTIRNNTYFDSGSGVAVYNNSGGGTVTHTRVAADTVTPLSPFAPKHSMVLKITTNGTASPGAGGFICQHTAKANAIFIEKFVALVPIGYTVVPAYNTQGTGSSVTMLSSNTGTGTWEEYSILYKCGSSGSYSTGGHVYISGSNNTSVTWYLAYCNNCEITGKEYLKAYCAIIKRGNFASNYAYSYQFDCCNLIPNGDCAIQETAMLPSGWSYDTTDYAGNAQCSLVQPVNAGAGTFGGLIRINPMQRYKVSYWVKCKQDMTSFLTACYLSANGVGLDHGSVVYKNGTFTQLTTELKSGDTTVTVKSNANWVADSSYMLGFRSNRNKSYNDLGKSVTNIISGVTGSTTINLSTAYSGSTIASGKYVVEGYYGGTYPYPIQKSALPTDNTWKYVEGYFGSADIIYYGANNIGWGTGIPWETTHMYLALNIYSNNGTVPIKFSDIRVEPISGSGTCRYQNKIQVH